MSSPKSMWDYLGEIIPGGILLLSYNQYSLGWKIVVKLMKDEIDAGGFGIITNVALPFRKFYRRMKSGGIDIIKEGEAGNLAVIDLLNKESPPYAFVYPLTDVDDTTIIPKYGRVHKRILQDYDLKNRRVVHALATLSTLYDKFGEKSVRDLLMARLRVGEKLIKEGLNFWDIFIVNSDEVPERFHSYLVSISDYVIIAQGILEENAFVENIAITKGPSEYFRPVLLQKRIPSILIPPEKIY
ncbi:hypothetical protein [Thermococcus sp. Bubb.Bath]|uniref:hypothetical protein n=1 Tax=Thermococcus sp. Bubb.Bath TaxID=1638242 RepID=UPI00143A4971|nr:hypothetical protein [Thermococcus sp. Bubb.Bath]NJF25715.1 hypothetical protein [Thermococcus sp. Bubb.Bath]